jgi:hypothetical protein
MQLQDTLLAYIRKNLRKLVNFYLSVLPEQVNISDALEVHNVYVLPRAVTETSEFDE